ncbi:MAG TPA: RNA-binding S4 domain-containing protein [Bacillota bacterium]|jgi:ribosomal 50S subunit-recycling heat shock protein|nr:RNA-binding S4 domain-containing protein [Bacillota bacterium]HQC48423.1 RNA-binding S4 domain-containing protein [Bacillota bacterium]
MRLDKFLKVSRIVKRRTVANDMCSAGRVEVNGRPGKPGTTVKVGDVLDIGYGKSRVKVIILDVREHVRKEEAESLYEVLESEGVAKPNKLD